MVTSYDVRESCSRVGTTLGRYPRIKNQKLIEMNKKDFLKTLANAKGEVYVTYSNLRDNDKLKERLVKAIEAKGLDVNDLKEDDNTFTFGCQFFWKEKRKNGIMRLTVKSATFYLDDVRCDYRNFTPKSKKLESNSGSGTCIQRIK